MPTTTRRRRARLSDASYQLASELAERSKTPISVVLDRAIALYWREQLFEEAGRQWAEIQADPLVRADLDAEMALWEETLPDGLEDLESWSIQELPARYVRSSPRRRTQPGVDRYSPSVIMPAVVTNEKRPPTGRTERGERC